MNKITFTKLGKMRYHNRFVVKPIDNRKFIWYKLYAFVVGRAYDSESGEPTLDYHFHSYCVYSSKAWEEILNERYGIKLK